MKKVISLLLCFVMLLCAVPITAFAVDDEVPEGYTGIYDIEDLYCIRYNLDKNYILMADIDMTEDTAEGGDWDNNGYGWAPIGENDTLPFTGTFDGNNHTIKGMQITNIKTNYAGLFGYTTGDIKDLTLDSAVITTSSACTYAGGVVGYSTGDFENITISNITMTTNSQYTAGLVGYWSGAKTEKIKVDGTITQTYSSSSYNSSAYAGGLIASVSGDSIIENCVNNSAVSGAQSQVIWTCDTMHGYEYVGGICGYIKTSSTIISNCYNVNNLTSNNYSDDTMYHSGAYSYSFAGGIAGKSLGETKNCYNSGEINSKALTGGSGRKYAYSSGIVGVGNATNCINLGTVTGEGGTPKISSVAYGTLDKCYYLNGTATNGKYNTTDTATTAVALSAAQMKLVSCLGYLDFENTWVMDVASGVEHPQLRSNREVDDSGVTVKPKTHDDEIPEGYVGIYDIEDLYAIRYGLDKNYILMADIDMTEDTAEGGDWDNNGYGWAPIGEDNTIPFTGTFDGNNHTIKGMQITDIKTNYAGLFGYTTGDIKDLTLDSAVITTSSACTYAGGVVGYSTGNFENITISNITMTTNTQYTAGLVGYWSGAKTEKVKVDGTITQEYKTANKESSVYAGGLIAYVSGDSIIENCVNNSAVSGAQSQVIWTCDTMHGYEYVGGICGYIKTSSTIISNCYNVNNLTSNNYSDDTMYHSGAYSYSFAGGIAGKSLGETKNCYNSGEINSKALTGGSGRKYAYSSGIVGEGNATNCINLGTVTGEGGTPTISSVAYGTLDKCYYLNGTATNGKYNTTDTATTAVALSATQMKIKGVFGYLDFENTWFIDTSKGVMHPQLISNPESGFEHDHVYETVVTNPTCTTKGYTTHTCSVCGDSYVDSYVDALGHDYDAVVTAPTCTTKGYTTHTCKECEDSYVDSEVDALGHDYGEWQVTTPATCTTKGVETRCCSRCTAKEIREIPLKAHNYESVVTNPTCTTKGYTTHTCKDCKHSYVDSYVDALGHDYRAVVKAPTCTEQGYTTHTCSRCKDSYVDSYVDALGHDYNTVVKAPTCTEQGYTTHTCTRCKDSYVDSYVPAKGHTDGEWKITKQATFTEEGERTLYCKDCGAVLKTEKIAKLEHGKVYSVDISDISMDYKASKTITPSIQIDNGVSYEVKYQSSNTKVATVDDNGKVYAKGTGNATITCTVTDSYGNVVSDTCNVKVSYTWWQWIIVILLFGWIWY